MKIKLAKSDIIHFVGYGGIVKSGLTLIITGKVVKVPVSDIVNKKNI